LGFSVPAVATAGLVAFFAMAAAPAPQQSDLSFSALPPTPVLSEEGRVGVPQRIEMSGVSAAEPTPPNPPLQAGEGEVVRQFVKHDDVIPQPTALGERPSSALPAPSPSEGRVSLQASLDAEPVLKPIETPQVTIKPGNSLWALSREIYGAGRHYATLLKANRDKIADPKLIYPGQVLATPKNMEE
jgi:nucleoid-associated protein YgaU